MGYIYIYRWGGESMHPVEVIYIYIYIYNSIYVFKFSICMYIGGEESQSTRSKLWVFWPQATKRLLSVGFRVWQPSSVPISKKCLRWGVGESERERERVRCNPLWWFYALDHTEPRTIAVTRTPLGPWERDKVRWNRLWWFWVLDHTQPRTVSVKDHRSVLGPSQCLGTIYVWG